MYRKLINNLILVILVLSSSVVFSSASENNSKAYDGYTLFSTLMSSTTNLINMDGDVVHTWQSDYSAAFSTYFLDNGHIFRAATSGAGGGMGGGMRGRGGFGGGMRGGFGDGQRQGPGGGPGQDGRGGPGQRGDNAQQRRGGAPGGGGPGGGGPGFGGPGGGMPAFDPNAFGGFGGMPRGGGPGFGGPGGGGPGFGAPGGGLGGGRIQEVDWDGNLIWDFEYHTDTEIPHHDIERMPNGNVLIVCNDYKTSEEAIAAGLNPEYQTDRYPSDCIIEVKPTGKTTGEVVWKWYVWDHLVQDFDPNKANYGKVAEHPELIDINYSEVREDQAAGKPGGGGFVGGPGGDWTHFNAVAYNEKLDQVMVCSRYFSEFWIIDHSTTTEEAASHKGGKHGKGGDLLYRWGNPAAYKSGNNADQRLFGPHDAQWIAKGFPGEGHILVFNNGSTREGEQYSSIEEVVLPMDEKGNYKMEGKTFGPKEPVWSYTDPNKTNFYGPNISGVQRLPNGNTLICNGPNGHLFEVTSDKEIVWDYRHSSGTGAGGPRGGGFGGMSQIFRAYRIAADHPGLSGKELVLRKDDTEN